MNRWPALARRIRVPLGFLFAALYLWRARPTWWSIAAGAAVVLPGLALRAVASGYVRKSLALTVTGPYAYSRNPLYLGTLIMTAGFVLAARDLWIALAAALLFALTYFPVMRWEEDYMRANFADFPAYAENVPRLLPRLGRSQAIAALSSAAAQPTGFSRELYLKHREYNAILGSGAVISTLVLKLLWFNR